MSEDILLEVNFLGKLLGKPSVNASKKYINFLYHEKIDKNFSIDLIEGFVSLDATIFGKRLYFIYDGKPIYSNFLKKNQVSNFIELINKCILENIQGYLGYIFYNFDSYVVNEFPRTSWINRIEALLSELSHKYNKQPLLWKQYLSPESIEKINFILSFYPLEIDSLREYHEKEQLKKRKHFFDNIESNPLTNDQRLGVIRTDDLNMVLAAAGTGKTSVIIAKALDIIDRGLAKPSEVLILAYNRAAADEIKERCQSKATNISIIDQPNISTFHALGRQVLREAGIPTEISVFAEDNSKLEQWVTKWIFEYVSMNPARIFELIELTTPPVDIFDFKSQKDYESYLRDNEFRTLNGEKVKGYQELQIANFLYVNKIEYEYEAKYITKRRLDVGFDYSPDFHIKNTEIYIEHYGIDRNGRTRPDIDSQHYIKCMADKKALHEECGTTLIETFHYEWKENILFPKLKEKLASVGIICNPMSPDEIFKKLNNQQTLGQWSSLMTKALSAIRIERLDKSTIFDRLQAHSIHNPEKYSELLDTLHSSYVSLLKEQNVIDFDDMIIRAMQAIKDGKYKPNWKYILVDEFQDISTARMEFIQSLIVKDSICTSLTVVGDDWQSIYRFSGGKLELTTRFGELFGKYALTKLQKTFRYNDSIAKTAGRFIMENPEQYKKNIETYDRVSEPHVYLYDHALGDNEKLYQQTLDIVSQLRRESSSSSIAIVARYNYLLDESKRKIWSAGFESNIHFWTFHKSKGLEADNCILIGFFQGKKGFPNQNRDNAIVEALLPSIDNFPHSEERRLLYVGITRAKKKCYIIADPSSPSEFVTELLTPKYELNIQSKYFMGHYRRMFKCPNCNSGYFRLIKGQFGDFYTCSSGLGCKVGKARVCEACGAPSVDKRSFSVCNNSNCENKLKICERCGRPMRARKGKYGEFMGCSGYGLRDDQCTHTCKK